MAFKKKGSYVVQGKTPEQIRAEAVAASKKASRSKGGFAGEGKAKQQKKSPDLRSMYADCPSFWNPPSGYRGPKWSDASSWGQPCSDGGGGMAEIPEDVGPAVAYTEPEEEENEALELASEEAGSDTLLETVGWRGQTLFELAADLDSRAQKLYGGE